MNRTVTQITPALNACGIAIAQKIMRRFATPHQHSCIELELILSGRGSTTINGQSRPIGANDLFFLTPLDLHDYLFEGEVGILNVQIGNAVRVDSRLLAAARQRSAFHLPPERVADFRALCDLIRHIPPEADTAQGYVDSLVHALLQLVVTYGGADVRREPPDKIDEVLSYLILHFRESPELTAVAEQFHFEPHYFCTLFKKRIGTTYTQYLKSLRLKHAAALLVQTDLSVTQIAAESGYRTFSHFLRSFKEEYALSPLDYRRAQKRK